MKQKEKSWAARNIEAAKIKAYGYMAGAIGAAALGGAGIGKVIVTGDKTGYTAAVLGVGLSVVSGRQALRESRDVGYQEGSLNGYSYGQDSLLRRQEHEQKRVQELEEERAAQPPEDSSSV